ncbi:MAG: GAF domain-containing protein [Kangiellaceae bacterium]|jgi:GAF domain-containing protein|nr:GAF domain-containing protein [Kangiellaceae bacterium]
MFDIIEEIDSLKKSVADSKALEVVAVDIVDVICNGLNIERCSIWHLEGGGELLRCEIMLERSKGLMREPMVLAHQDYPQYFAALLTGQPIIANDARTQPSTREFTNIYLVPNDIYSMLDIPIIKSGVLKGIICCEQVGSKKVWSGSDQAFLSQIADVVTPLF